MSDFRLLITFFVFVLLVEIIWSSDLILQNQVLKRENEQFLKKVAHGKMGWDGRIL